MDRIVRMLTMIFVGIVSAIALLSCNRQEDYCYDPQGNRYTTARMGTQVWMTENLLYNAGEGCFCYNDNPRLCEEMGRLYTWEAALRAANEIEGWHLPSRQEWEDLIRFCGPDSVGYFNLVSDTTGFNPQWSGVRVSSGVFKAKGLGTANYWSSSISDTNSTLAFSVAVMSNLKILSPHNYPIVNACSVRLIKDR
jgi:uncharacterized protein (TIGR02145 family)